MKLYLASYSYPYEGGAVIGAFESKEKALAAIKDLEEYIVSSADIEITEIELNSSLEVCV